ncbi:hypothetical protein HG531_009901 [Fusarium graminearum]|nr:hypothetical protein HG531_009901 [Fusarium graminearum]
MNIVIATPNTAVSREICTPLAAVLRVVIAASRVGLDNTLLQLGLKRVVLIKVPDQHLVLGIKSSNVLVIHAEEVVTATSKEVKRDNAILGLILERLIVELQADQLGSVLVVRVELDLETLGNLEPRGDLLVVVLDLATGDVTLVNCGANSTGVDKSEAGLVIVGATLVEAVLEHGVGHDLSEQTVSILACRLVKLGIRVANDFSGKLLKGTSPRLDLLLEVLIHLGLVGEVDGSTVVCEGLAVLVKGQVDGTKVLAPSVGSNNEDFITVDVVNDCGTLRLGGKLLVHIVAKVSERNNTVDLGLVADFPYSLLHFGDGVEESSLVSNTRDSRRSISGHTNDGQVMLLKDLIVLDSLVETLVLALDIARDDRESQVLKKLAELLVTAIPLVVSEGHGVKVEGIQVLCNLGRSVERVEERSLELVTGIEPQVVRIVLS